MTKEFKKISNPTETRYVLENASGGASAGGTSSASVSSNGATPMNLLAGLQRRIQELKTKTMVPISKPRNPMGMGSTPGRGTEKHKSNQRQQERDSKKMGEGDHLDHEVNMAQADTYQLAKQAVELHKLLHGVSELQGLEGWQQSKITKAADYINAVYKSLTHNVSDDGEIDEQGMAEDSSDDLVYISVDRVEEFEEWMGKEGFETDDVPKTYEGTYVVYDYSDQDHISKMYADDWNEKKGMAEGNKYGYDDFGHSLAPGHDEGEPVYSKQYDIAGNQPYHLVNKDTGRPLMKKDKSGPAVFDSQRHANAVASKLKFGNWTTKPAQEVDETWSKKYKDSINCSNPKGFSQKAHCAGKNKEESMAEGDGYDDWAARFDTNVVAKPSKTLERLIAYIPRFKKEDPQEQQRVAKAVDDFMERGMSFSQAVVLASPRGVAEDSEKVCPQCGMAGCKCAPGKCKCTPKPGFPKLIRQDEDKIKGVDGKACWKGKRYAGKKKKADGTYKDICIPVKEDAYFDKLNDILTAKLK